jgi:hypothetical protein
MRSFFALLFATLTAIVGYHMHGQVFYTICDFIFWPFVWIKWLVCHEVTLSLIKESFSWFFV